MSEVLRLGGFVLVLGSSILLEARAGAEKSSGFGSGNVRNVSERHIAPLLSAEMIQGKLTGIPCTGGTLWLRNFDHFDQSVMIDTPGWFPLSGTGWGFLTGHNSSLDRAILEQFSLQRLGIDTFWLQAVSFVFRWQNDGTVGDVDTVFSVVVYDAENQQVYRRVVNLDDPAASGVIIIPLDTSPGLFLLVDTNTGGIALTDSFQAGVELYYPATMDTICILSTLDRHNDTTAMMIDSAGMLSRILHPNGTGGLNLILGVRGEIRANVPQVQILGWEPRTYCAGTRYPFQVEVRGIPWLTMILVDVNGDLQLDTIELWTHDLSREVVPISGYGGIPIIVRASNGCSFDLDTILPACELSARGISLFPLVATSGISDTFFISTCPGLTFTWAGTLSGFATFSDTFFAVTYGNTGVDTVLLTGTAYPGCSVSDTFWINVLPSGGLRTFSKPGFLGNCQIWIHPSTGAKGYCEFTSGEVGVVRGILYSLSGQWTGELQVVSTGMGVYFDLPEPLLSRVSGDLFLLELLLEDGRRIGMVVDMSSGAMRREF